MTSDTKDPASTTPVRAVGYARISLDKRDGAGVERQRASIEDMAAQRGYHLTEVLVDNSISAYSGAERPGYARLVELIKSHAVDRVLVWHTDRLHRNVRDTLEYMETTREAGVVTEAVQGAGIDPTTADAFLTTTVLAAVAEQESRHKAERIRAAAYSAAHKGAPNLSGRRTFGYRRELDRLVLEPREAAALRRAADNILAGSSIRREYVRLNEDGFTTTAGKPFDSMGIRTLLTNPRLAGYATWHGEIIGKGQWPPVFEDTERWEALQAILSDPARKTNKRGNKPTAQGSGLYFCGHCGAPMYHRWRKYPNGRKVQYYYTKKDLAPNDVPGNHVTRMAEPLDTYVAQTILSRLASVDLGLVTSNTQDQVRMEDLRQQRQDLNARIEGVERAVVSGDFTPAQGGKMNRELQAKLERVEAGLAALTDTDHALSPLVDVADLTAWWAAADLEAKRAVIRATARIYLEPGATTGRGNFEPELVRFEWLV